VSAAHDHDAGHQGACRLDVWLWRARFFKTRSLAAHFLDGGRVRLIRHGAPEIRVDKASRTVRPGEGLVFAISGRLYSITVEALGERRGPPSDARTLYREASG
jgi:ribosomal 50S subunit-recycling heat shock protein